MGILFSLIKNKILIFFLVHCNTSSVIFIYFSHPFIKREINIVKKDSSYL